MSADSMKAAIHTTLRDLRREDIEAVVQLDAQLTGVSKQIYWDSVFEHFLLSDDSIGLAATNGEHLEGFLFGEIRAFEFGSEACGWVFAVGVNQDSARSGIASALLAESRQRFRTLGVNSVRTMVRRTDVPLLSFFRAHGFVGGPFVQLELDVTTADNEEQGS
jgi:ribosomal protein S18 acetylase RimI-like enzyme